MEQKKIIKAVSICHNTPEYMELMIRSLYANNSFDNINFYLTVYDNNSNKDITNLSILSDKLGFKFKQSGFKIEPNFNSHGMILDTFVKENQDCDYYLMLDTDIIFVQKNTVSTLLNSIEKHPHAYGTGPFLSWDGINKKPLPDKDKGIPDQYICRLHPCCALYRNNNVFRLTVENIGFEPYKRMFLSHDIFNKIIETDYVGVHKKLGIDREELVDTAQMIKRVMDTHGRYHFQTEALIFHFEAVSYDHHSKEIKDYHKSKLKEYSDLYADVA